jgi:hypothetical protein
MNLYRGAGLALIIIGGVFVAQGYRPGPQHGTLRVIVGVLFVLIGLFRAVKGRRRV